MLAIEANGRTLVQLADGSICDGVDVWSLTDGEKVKGSSCSDQSEGAEKDVVNAVVQLSDGRVCTGTSKGAVKIWNLKTGTVRYFPRNSCR